jgi:hypothetical protein
MIADKHLLIAPATAERAMRRPEGRKRSAIKKNSQHMPPSINKVKRSWDRSFAMRERLYLRWKA